MRAPGVGAMNPGDDLPSWVREVGEGVQPDALFLEGAEEAFDDAVLLGGVRRNAGFERRGVALGEEPQALGACSRNLPTFSCPFSE